VFNTLDFRFSYGDTTLIISGANAILLNEWNNLVISRINNSLVMYVNGRSITTATDSTNISSGSALILGRCSPSAIQFLNGNISLARIYKARGLTSGEVYNNFVANRGRFGVYSPVTLPVSGAALWLDASQQSTLFTDAGTTPVTTSGQSVYQWNDLSGNNRHATQATSGSRPTWLSPENGQNGLGAIRFNRANSQWMMDQMASVTIGSIYVVYYHSTGNALYSSFIASSTAAGPLPASDIEFRFAVPAGNYDSFVALHSHNFSSISSRINNSAVISNFYNYIYGQEINTSNRCQLMSFTMTPKSGSMNLVLGQDAAPLSGRFSNMELCEIVMFPSQHSQEQIDLMESYLKTKWRTP
jgi:hypothetical protein